jgi:hypothetical protein
MMKEEERNMSSNITIMLAAGVLLAGLSGVLAEPATVVEQGNTEKAETGLASAKAGACPIVWSTHYDLKKKRMKTLKTGPTAGRKDKNRIHKSPKLAPKPWLKQNPGPPEMF